MDHSYMAGMIDGEGCITISRASKGRSFSIRVDVGMSVKALPLLERMQSQYGGTIAAHRQSTDRWSEARRWTVNGKQAAVTLAAVSPFLLLKDRQAVIALSLHGRIMGAEKSLTGKRSTWTDELMDYATRAKAEIERLNAKGPERPPLAAPGALIGFWNGSSWVTPQQTLDGVPEQFSGTWPKRGTTRNGAAFEHPTWAPPTDGYACSSLLPTPAAGMPNDGEDPASWLARAERLKEKHGNGNGAGTPLAIAVKMLPTPTAQDSAGSRGHRLDGTPYGPTSGVTLTDAVSLLPTPTASDRFRAGSHGEGGPDLRTAVSLLPTPTSRDWKDGAPCKNVETNGLLGRAVWSIGDRTSLPSDDGNTSPDQHPGPRTTRGA